MKDDFAYLAEVYDQPIGVVLAKLPGVGDKLPNGAYILKEVVLREYDYRRDSLVLCFVPESRSRFVSWLRLVTTNSPRATGGFSIQDSCSFGDYARQGDNLDVTLEKFNQRVAAKVAILNG